jgi:hypothetical protein
MKFAIQISNPRPMSMVHSHDATLSDAIQSMFPLLTEFAIIVWNDVYVPITYKLDVSLIINDVVEMVGSIANQQTGTLTIDWPSSTFRARWTLTWAANELSINSTWDSVIGGAEALLNAAPALTIEKTAFLAEWANLLRLVRDLVSECSEGVKLEFDLSELRAAVDRLPLGGHLYARHGSADADGGTSHGARG